MLDHVSLGVRDINRSCRFYNAELRPLGLVRTVDFGGGRISASVLPTARQSKPFIWQLFPPEAATMARPDCDRTITLTITAPSC